MDIHWQRIISEIDNMKINLKRINTEIDEIVKAIIQIDKEIGVNLPIHYRLITDRYKSLYKEREKLYAKLGKTSSKKRVLEKDIESDILNNRLQLYGFIDKEICLLRDRTRNNVRLDKNIEEMYLVIDFFLKQDDDLEELTIKWHKSFPKKLNEVKDKIANIQLELNSEYSRNNAITIVVACWELFYYNGSVSWTYENQTYRFDTPLSKDYFNKFKRILSYLVHEQLTITIDLQNNCISDINGIGTISQYFNYLEVDQLLTDYNLGDIEYFRKKILNNIDNNCIASVYNLKNRSVYLGYLISRQGNEYKIIPTSERRAFRSNNLIIKEDAFLFSFIVNNSSYIIWENLEESRATHIFHCSKEEYSNAIQKVYDYIVSPEIANKREILHTSCLEIFKGNKGSVAYCGWINHTCQDEWKSKLDEICQ